ncbi:hypothetical protein GUJ93_ZPchr0010g9616 [Zizania palustris]|uniref:Uncharacterized protein n=1 Tax=Zizania palustris TaxID=103762 RepID=A0A8J5THQ7_ZIZPA|nr:hypothetical protein GUJ93_ZPchr0010g9616 [Zizania palustris]
MQHELPTGYGGRCDTASDHDNEAESGEDMQGGAAGHAGGVRSAPMRRGGPNGEASYLARKVVVDCLHMEQGVAEEEAGNDALARDCRL